MQTEINPLESLLHQDRWIVTGSLVLLTGLAWAYLFSGAGMHMSILDMTIISFFPYQQTDMSVNAMIWTYSHTFIMFIMWWVMMIAMMLPSASPVILLYSRLIRHNQQLKNYPVFLPTLLFLAGYLATWGIFSGLATTLQWMLDQNNYISMHMMISSAWLSGGLLIMIGIYQLTPLKLACLKHCRSPADFISTHMQSGPVGACLMGIRHGLYCLGCCWLLMLLLFIGGIMNVLWIALLSIFVFTEKVLPRGIWVSRISGCLLLIWGLVMFIHVSAVT